MNDQSQAVPMTSDATVEYVAHSLGGTLFSLSEVYKALTDPDSVVSHDVAVTRLRRCVERLAELNNYVQDKARAERARVDGAAIIDAVEVAVEITDEFVGGCHPELMDPGDGLGCGMSCTYPDCEAGRAATAPLRVYNRPIGKAPDNSRPALTTDLTTCGCGQPACGWRETPAREARGWCGAEACRVAIEGPAVPLEVEVGDPADEAPEPGRSLGTSTGAGETIPALRARHDKAMSNLSCAEGLIATAEVYLREAKKAYVEAARVEYYARLDLQAAQRDQGC